MLNVHSKEVVSTSDVSQGCFSEARRDGHCGFILQTASTPLKADRE